LPGVKGYSQPVEYTLKALYIEKFTRFTEWPDSCEINNKETPFIIATLGQTPFKENLENIFSIQHIYNKPVKVIETELPGKAEKFHILFIPNTKKDSLESIINLVGEKPVLTVGDTPEYGKRGVLINFYTENDKLKFEINETALQKSPLEFNFHLLNMAKIVEPLNKEDISR